MYLNSEKESKTGSVSMNLFKELEKKKLGFRYPGENQMLMFRGKEYAHKIYTLECQ